MKLPEDLPAATVEIRPGVYLHTIWALASDKPIPAAIPHRSADFLATLLRVDDGPWEFRSRIRLHLAHGSADPKRHYDQILPGDEVGALAWCQGAINAARKLFPDATEVARIQRDGSEMAEIMQILGSISAFHIEHLTPAS